MASLAGKSHCCAAGQIQPKNRRAEQKPSHHDCDNLYLGEPAE